MDANGSTPLSSSPGRTSRGAVAGTVRVEVHEDPASLEAPELAAFWDRAVEEAGPLSTFRSRDWLVPWWHHFGSPAALRLLVAYRGATVVGLLPLFAQRERVAGLGYRRWQLMGTGIAGSDYLGIVSRAEDEDSVCDALIEALEVTDASVIDLTDLESDDLLLRSARRSGASSRERFACPNVALKGDFRSYLATRPDGLGTQFTRRRRWLERQALSRLEILGPGAEPAAIGVAMDHLFRLHAARWNDQSDGFDGPRVMSFHREAAQRLAKRGWLKLYLLHARDEVVAALYALERGTTLQFYQAGFDPAWAARSVGTVLLGLVLEDCFTRGLTEFDFLRGQEPYKLRWATGARQTHNVRLVAPTRSARAFAAMDGARRRLRGFARRSLPTWVRAAWIEHERRGRQIAGGGY